MTAAVHEKNIERLTGPRFLGPIRVFRTGYPVNRLTVNIPTQNHYCYHKLFLQLFLHQYT